MKKILSLLLVLALSFTLAMSFVACSDETAGNENGELNL